jgi:hypothetical protein
MLAASAKFRPALAWFARQIAPSVLATLIAALVIAGYNRAFSGHLQQPRMAALHAAMDKAAGEPATPAAAEADAVTGTTAKPKPAWATQVVEIIAPTGDVVRSFDKDEGREAAKDQSKSKVADVAPAAAPAPRPVAVRQELPKQEPRQEFRQEWREPRVAEPQVVVVDPRGVVPMAPPPGGYLAIQQPVVVQPLQPAPVAVAPMAAPMVPVAQPPVAAMPIAQPPIAREPPPVITAAKPMVTVPDRPGLRPAYEAPAPGQVQPQQAEAPPQQRPGVLGAIVDTLKPSSLFRSAREFGDKIEAAGNDILPNIRQQ